MSVKRLLHQLSPPAEEEDEFCRCKRKQIRALSNEDPPPKYELRFLYTALDHPIYTKSEITADNGKPVGIAIFCNNEKITSGPLSSLRIKVFALNGEFSENGQCDWSSEDFSDNIVRPRVDKGPLLKGQLALKLENGETYFDQISFNDNSSWTRMKMFRLGVRVIDTIQERVLEGVSGTIRVKDRHGKACEKRDIPLLDDKVRLLKQISTKRVEILQNHCIFTVKDFLQYYYKDESALLKILGFNSEFDKSWKDMIKHAKQCHAGDNLYSHRISNQNDMLFFSSVYELLGVKFGDCYKSFTELNPSQKADVGRLKEIFYKKDTADIHFDHKMVDNKPIPLNEDQLDIGANQQLYSPKNYSATQDYSEKYINNDPFSQNLNMVNTVSHCHSQISPQGQSSTIVGQQQDNISVSNNDLDFSLLVDIMDGNQIFTPVQGNYEFLLEDFSDEINYMNNILVPNSTLDTTANHGEIPNSHALADSQHPQHFNSDQGMGGLMLMQDASPGFQNDQCYAPMHAGPLWRHT